MALPKSVCDDCINAECLWRAPTGGSDPPVMVCPSKIEKPKTKADHIRAMTDEELAKWHSEIQFEVSNYYCHGVDPKLPKSKKAWLEWLKSPMEE